MSELKTTDGDLAIENNALVLITGINEVRQRVEQRLRMVRGEWFLDTTAGLPWLTDMLIKGPNMDMVESLLKAQITETPGVKELTKFELELNNQTREAVVVAEFIGTEGDIGLLEVTV